MATSAKCDPTRDIVLGIITVGNGTRIPATHEDTATSLHWASGDSLAWVQVSDRRFNVAPTGWSA